MQDWVQVLKKKKENNKQTDRRNKTRTAKFKFRAPTTFAPKDVVPFLSYVSKEGRKK